MNKTIAGLGVLALVALGATGATFPANALEIQPVAEIVAQSDAIIASPDAVLLQSEPAVITTPAEVPVEPVVATVEPVEASTEPVATVETAVVVAASPVASEPVAVDPYSGNPIVECPVGELQAEDFTCVPASFWTPEIVAPAIPACFEISRTNATVELAYLLDCYRGEAQTFMPHHVYLGSAVTVMDGADLTSSSVQFPGIIHSYRVEPVQCGDINRAEGEPWTGWGNHCSVQ